MKFQSLLAAALTLAAPVLAIPAKRLTTPANDDFYVPPAGFESTKPGAVLKQRYITASIFGIIPTFNVISQQVLYRTTAIDGSPIATVTTIFKPWVSRSDRFIAFNTAYDSSASICNPSYNYQWGSLQTDLISSAEFLLIQAYLLSGYTVASADYEGPDAAFTAGRLSGMGVLDGMRAVVNFASHVGLDANPMIVNAGYSGGAIAGSWAAALQPKYAPELNMKGWILGGTPANLTQVLEYVDNTLFSGFLPGAFAGLLKPSAYGAKLKPVLEKIITPTGQEIIADGNNNCVAINLIKYADISIFDTNIQTLGTGLLSEPTVAEVLQDTIVGLKPDETPTTPVMLYHAKDDEIIPFGAGQALNERWCARGVDVSFTNYAAGGHATTEVVAIVDAINFAGQAFDGTVPKGCSSKSVLTDKLNPLALGLSLEPVLAALAGELLSFGKKDSNWMKAVEGGKIL